MTLTPHARQSTRTDHGFTLLELLIALVLVAGAAALLPAAFRTAQQALRSGVDMEGERHIAEIRAYLRRIISTAMPLIVKRPESGQIGNAFWGDRHAVTFVSPSETGPHTAGNYVHTLRVRREAAAKGGASVHRLVLEVSQLRPFLDPQATAISETILVETTLPLTIRYFGPVQDGIGMEWLTDWTDPRRHPELIAIDLPASPHATAGILPLIVAPALGPQR